MIDEVQDLPHATIVLLSKVTEQGLFFSGDTAQTISKGVGLRFCDLSAVFNQNLPMKQPKNFKAPIVFKAPVVKQLTVY